MSNDQCPDSDGGGQAKWGLGYWQLGIGHSLGPCGQPLLRLNLRLGCGGKPAGCVWTHKAKPRMTKVTFSDFTARLREFIALTGLGSNESSASDSDRAF